MPNPSGCERFLCDGSGSNAKSYPLWTMLPFVCIYFAFGSVMFHRTNSHYMKFMLYNFMISYLNWHPSIVV